MNYRTLMSGTALLVLAAGVAGCKSSGSSGGLGYAPVFATEAGTAAEALEDGLTLESGKQLASATNRNWSEDTSGLSDAEFAVKANAAGGVDITVNGETVSFTNADALANGSGWSRVDADGGRELYSWNGPAADALDPNTPDYSQAWRYFIWDNDTSTEQAGFAVVGTETEASVLENKANATYRGYMRADARPNDGSRDRTELEAGTPTAAGIAGSGVTLNADFAAATISGEVTGIIGRQRSVNAAGDPVATSWAQVPGRIVMNEADINGNGFTGNLTGEGDFADLLNDLGDDASYSGRFFGPNAEEASGVVKIQGEDGSGTGFFRTFQQ